MGSVISWAWGLRDEVGKADEARLWDSQVGILKRKHSSQVTVDSKF